MTALLVGRPQTLPGNGVGRQVLDGLEDEDEVVVIE